MPATELYSFQVTIPAGTAITAPFRQSVPIPVRMVDRLEITIPPGPSGLMGFAITMGGLNVIPLQAGTYIVTDNQQFDWPIEGLPTSGAWQVSGYNIDVWDHTVYLRFLTELVTSTGTPPLLSTVNMQQLSS